MLGLLLATAVALLWNTYGMYEVMRIDARTPWLVSAVDDRDDDNRGASVAVIGRTKGAIELGCRIVKQYEWPFCEMQVHFSEFPGGIDLSRYDSVQVRATVDGPEKDKRLRLYLRQYNPAYTHAGDPNSLKINEIVVDPMQSAEGAEIPMTQFAVADWWLDSHPVPARDAGVELDRVVDLGLATGSTVVDGEHRIRLESIEFRGKWIAPATFRLGVIAVWMASLLGYLVVDAVQSRRLFRRLAARELELASTNESLRAQTQRLTQRALHDPLTGLLNRGGFAASLEQHGAQRDETLFPMALVFVDIDHFKRINDAHGHAVGDSVIQGVARIVREHVQRDDLVARWGGEEFLIACPHTRDEESVGIAQRLREKLSSETWPKGLAITCSFGVTRWRHDEPLADGIARADEAMYRAKRDGRDRIEVRWPDDEGGGGGSPARDEVRDKASASAP